MVENGILVFRARSGDNESLAQLWNQNKRIIYKLAYQFQNQHFSIDDLLQETYFPFLRAVKAYDVSGEYKFITYLFHAVKWYYIRLLKQSKTGKELCILDAPFNTSEPEGMTLQETIPDESSEFEEAATDRAAIADIFERVQVVLNSEVAWGKLGYEVILENFVHKKTINEIAEKYGEKPERIRFIRGQALRILRHPKHKQIRDLKDVISGTYHLGGLQRFKNTGTSSTEWAVMKLNQ